MFCTKNGAFVEEESFDGKEKSLCVDTLQKKIDELEKKSKENFELFLRTKADVENMRKRAEEQVVNAKKHANDSFILSLLNLADSIEFGLGVCKENVIRDEENSSVYVGLRLIYEMLLALLNRCDVKQIDSLGEKFNPYEHEAVLLQDCADKKKGIVVGIIQKGYIKMGRVIRHAKVIVTK